ncbi:hypothetical protein ACFU3O_14755 [Streptomyces antibioticus]|uniref:hypothetical protein n=1 Tax=Streptomyces antibioticus TaxID=1890 RepID=UPI0036799EDF
MTDAHRAERPAGRPMTRWYMVLHFAGASWHSCGIASVRPFTGFIRHVRGGDFCFRDTGDSNAARTVCLGTLRRAARPRLDSRRSRCVRQILSNSRSGDLRTRGLLTWTVINGPSVTADQYNLS